MQFPSLITTGLTLLSLSVGSALATERPNIIVIKADDLGYGDVSYNPDGEGDFETPNIDRIAALGVSFTQGYAQHAVCGPSRAGFVTGRYQHRFGYFDNIGPIARDPEEGMGIPLNQQTIGNYLSEAGYVTGHIGKWHDGDEQEYWPYNRGFQEFFGFNNGAASYFVGPVNQTWDAPWSAIYREDGERVANFPEYLTQAFGNEAVDFIDRHKDSDQPLFLYLAHLAPHGPMEATEADLAKFEHIEDEARRTSVAMVHSMDNTIGDLLDKLEEEEMLENTLIFFTSDNGGEGYPHSSNKPHKGIKGTTYEGGLRVPYLMMWKGVVMEGVTLDSPATGIDISATLLNAAIGEPDPKWQLDGVNLLPYASGQTEQLEERFLYWQTAANSAIRNGEWKWVDTRNTLYRGHQKGGRVQALYRISEDPAETTDLSRQYPEVAENMRKEFERWQSLNEPARFGWNPAFGTRVGYRGKHKD
ncbi:sulfatase-like hydrolase/transferase [Ferrimonas pelagia]